LQLRNGSERRKSPKLARQLEIVTENESQVDGLNSQSALGVNPVSPD